MTLIQKDTAREIDMYSWECLEPKILSRGGPVTTAFLHAGLADFRSAAQWVCSLPYGRNSDPNAQLIVFTEGRGTCSTKHALIRRLAIEQRLDVALSIGIYEMTAQNTPGVGAVLEKYDLKALPEAHCYLRFGQKRVDLTRFSVRPPTEGISSFLHEEDIEPEQIGSYKIKLHRQFLSLWMTRRETIGYNLDELWRIREECIAGLSEDHS
jgi:hypothetical protein